MKSKNLRGSRSCRCRRCGDGTRTSRRGIRWGRYVGDRSGRHISCGRARTVALRCRAFTRRVNNDEFTSDVDRDVIGERDRLGCQRRRHDPSARRLRADLASTNSFGSLIEDAERCSLDRIGRRTCVHHDQRTRQEHRKSDDEDRWSYVEGTTSVTHPRSAFCSPRLLHSWHTPYAKSMHSSPNVPKSRILGEE